MNKRNFVVWLVSLACVSSLFAAEMSTVGGGSVNLAAPGPIGGTTPGTGAFSSITIGGGAILNNSAPNYLSLPGGGLISSAVFSPIYTSSNQTITIQPGGTNNSIILTPIGTGTVEERNGTTAQKFRLYNTYTDASNYSRLLFDATGPFVITGEAAGTGVNQQMRIYAPSGQNLLLGANAGINWQITTGGVLLANTDNAYDIGANGAGRPRSIYPGFGLFVPTNGYVGGVTGSSAFQFPSANTITALSSGSTGDVRLQFNGTTSAFPSLQATPFYSSTFTVTIAAPGVFTTSAAHNLSIGDIAVLTTTGALPTGLATVTNYFVQSTPSTTTFTLAATLGGAAITTTGTQSGVHTITRANAIYVRAADNSVDVPLINGQYLVPSTGLATAVQWGASGTQTGMFIAGGGRDIVAFASNGVQYGAVNNQGFMAPIASAFEWGNDTYLVRDGAANTVAQRNGTNNQTFNVYGTYTDASNYARVGINVNATRASLFTTSAGTGTVTELALTSSSNLFFRTSSTDRWQVNASGHLVAVTDASYDIGASGANRPRSIYTSGMVLANAVRMGSTSNITIDTQSGAPLDVGGTQGAIIGGGAASGNVRLGGFGIIGVGFTGSPTNTSPGFKKVNTAIAFRRADDTIGVFSDLPVPAASNEGAIAPISDSTTNVWGATITGGGTNHVLAYSDGTNWTVMAK